MLSLMTKKKCKEKRNSENMSRENFSKAWSAWAIQVKFCHGISNFYIIYYCIFAQVNIVDIKTDLSKN